MDLHDRLDRALPVVEEHADHADSEGRFPEESIAALAEAGLLGKLEHLGGGDAAEPSRGDAPALDDDAESLEIDVPNPHGLHARPAARLVALVGDELRAAVARPVVDPQPARGQAVREVDGGPRRAAVELTGGPVDAPRAGSHGPVLDLCGRVERPTPGAGAQRPAAAGEVKQAALDAVFAQPHSAQGGGGEAVGVRTRRPGARLRHGCPGELVEQLRQRRGRAFRRSGWRHRLRRQRRRNHHR